MKIFRLPDLGEGLQEAELVEWRVQAGDDVAVDQPLVSVETAKAVVEIPSPQAGRIERLFADAGDMIRIGAPLVGFEGGADEGRGLSRRRRSAPARAWCATQPIASRPRAAARSARRLP